MQFIENIHSLAKANLKKIILPETDDIRIIKAAIKLAEQKIAMPVFIRTELSIVNKALALNLDITLQQKLKKFLANQSIEQIEFKESTRNKFLKIVNQKYFKQQLTVQQTEQLLNNNIHQAALLLQDAQVDGMVAGINTSTADILKTSFKIIGLNPNYKTASSFFIMLLNNQVLVFADCATVVEPTAEQLVDICLATVENSKQFLADEPRVAMLSFSTEASANHPNAQKIAKATLKIKQLNPQLNILGEVQFDAAIDENVAKIKLKTQKFTKAANIFIFPDLNSGNIGYKICQRLAGAKAIGPILQGFKFPVNDLSRGASVEEIVNIVAITSIQSPI